MVCCVQLRIVHPLLSQMGESHISALFFFLSYSYMCSLVYIETQLVGNCFCCCALLRLAGVRLYSSLIFLLLLILFFSLPANRRKRGVKKRVKNRRGVFILLLVVGRQPTSSVFGGAVDVRCRRSATPIQLPYQYYCDANRSAGCQLLFISSSSFFFLSFCCIFFSLEPCCADWIRVFIIRHQ